MAAQANFGNLISALNKINAQIDQINALNDIDVNRVHIVDADDVANGNNVQATNNALNGLDLTVLQNFLNGNTVLNNVLNEANVLVTDVVAVNVLSGRSSSLSASNEIRRSTAKPSATVACNDLDYDMGLSLRQTCQASGLDSGSPIGRAARRRARRETSHADNLHRPRYLQMAY